MAGRGCASTVDHIHLASCGLGSTFSISATPAIIPVTLMALLVAETSRSREHFCDEDTVSSAFNLMFHESERTSPSMTL